MATRWAPRSRGGKRNSSSAFGEWDYAGRGTGKRCKAEFWSKGVSGKQNKTFVDGSTRDRSVAYIFADSQLRPVVQGDVELPQGPIQMIINSTPGGTCHHVEKELLDFSWRRKPDIVVVAAGTNNIGFGLESLDVACKQIRSLLRSALCMTPQVYNSPLCY
ncbi:uncharacterized protein LOC100892486 [Strongylocentrotus purpuratus]|uniref:SGNH hydrolase-type esterase domain-containing protein n=1 Tax=Strongylocentrotus purpuratus TaxID=7668 RepID=A0A7M7PJ83_STRPU|nr:uncharacterized protein LOC100892486 [Strongylocentrotus purpuratus]